MRQSWTQILPQNLTSCTSLGGLLHLSSLSFQTCREYDNTITQPWRRVVQITRQPHIGVCVVPASGWAPWLPLVPSHQPPFGLCLCLLHVSLLLLPFHNMREKGSLWSLYLEGCRSIFLPQWSRIIENLYSTGSADFFCQYFLLNFSFIWILVAQRIYFCSFKEQPKQEKRNLNIKSHYI